MSTPLSEFPDSSATSHTFSFGGYATEEVGLAGVTFWPRAGARLIDYVLHYCVTYAAGLLFSILVIAASGGHMPCGCLQDIGIRGSLDSSPAWPVFWSITWFA